MSRTAAIPKAQSLLLSNATLEEAYSLAFSLMGEQHADRIKNGNHPDLHLLTPEGKSDLHPISSIQKLIEEIPLPPYEASAKLFLIEDAEKMLPPAANALLKTLEEPPEDTRILLLSNHPDRLLPTILSRLTPIKFQTKEVSLPDLSPYFSLAERGEWDLVFERLPELEEVDPEDLLQACLAYGSSKSDPEFFQIVAECVGKMKEAIQHNVKPLNAFSHLLISLST